MIAFVVFVLPLALYISRPSRMWNFDGVACAIALEWGNPVYLFHGNHLWYGFLGSLFWKFGLLPLGLTRALPALQLFTSLLSAAGLIGLYLILVEMVEPLSAALLTLTAGVCAVFWVWSLEAQVYPLGFLPLAFASWLLLRPRGSRNWRAIGLLQGLAVLGHIIHLLWMLPALYWLQHESVPGVVRQKKMRDYFSVLISTAAIPYALVLGAVIAPRHPHARWLWRWVLGSSALQSGGHFAWHSSGWTSPLLWGWTSLRFFWGALWPYHVVVTPLDWALTAVSMAGVFFLLLRSFQVWTERLWRVAFLWVAAYAVLFWTWEAGTECYRLTEVVPLFIWMALGLNTLRSRALQAALVSVILITTAAANLRTRILPMHDAGRNAQYVEISELARRTPDESLYLTTGDRRWIYLLYFTGRTAWNIRQLETDPAHLASEIAREVQSVPVFIMNEALQDPLVLPLINPYKMHPIPGLSWLQIR